MSEQITQVKSNGETISSDYGMINSSDKMLWQRIVADWLSGDLSQQAFCQQHRLNKNTLSYWRGKFLTQEKKQKQNLKKLNKPDKPTKTTFVPVTLSSDINFDNRNGASEVIQLKTPNGYVLSMPMTMGQEGLEQLLSFMGQ